MCVCVFGASMHVSCVINGCQATENDVGCGLHATQWYLLISHLSCGEEGWKDERKKDWGGGKRDRRMN